MKIINGRERFLAAMHQEKLGRPPVWLMRQAGRYLPEYRALKEKYDFLTLVKNPELATEVTLQPLKRFPLDAAIIFSDILVIPEAMGQGYYFRDHGGISMNYPLQSMKDVENLNTEQIADSLSYVFNALKLTKKELGDSTALLGFCGSPWTLACYMIEGGSSKDFQKVKDFINEMPIAFNLLMEKLTSAISTYINLQIESGVDSIQIFDSWASLCEQDNYYNLSLKWIEKIISNRKRNIPIILFAKGMDTSFDDQLKTGAQALSVDWTISLSEAAQLIENRCTIQGNLDPEVLTTTTQNVKQAVSKTLEMSQGIEGYIFNLGHGMLPNAKIECVETLFETIQEFNYA